MGSVWYWSPLMLITPTWSGQYVPQIFKWGESPIAPTHVPPHFSLIWPGYSQKSLNEECLILVPTLARYVSFEPLTTLVRDTLTWPVFRMHIILSLHNFFFFFTGISICLLVDFHISHTIALLSTFSAQCDDVCADKVYFMKSLLVTVHHT